MTPEEYAEEYARIVDRIDSLEKAASAKGEKKGSEGYIWPSDEQETLEARKALLNAIEELATARFASEPGEWPI